LATSLLHRRKRSGLVHAAPLKAQGLFAARGRRRAAAAIEDPRSKMEDQMDGALLILRLHSSLLNRLAAAGRRGLWPRSKIEEER
jgi:hypothetical protein